MPAPGAPTSRVLRSDDTRDESVDLSAPREGWLALFLMFLRFGLLAWGGPVAQIDLLRQELVDRRRWIQPELFGPVLAVYQALPGPEATELCCYFGTVRKGRLGGIVAGLGFLLPGFVIMLLASWAYTRFGMGHALATAALAGAQPAAAALVCRAVYRLSRSLVRDDPWLAVIAAVSLGATLLGVNFAFVLLCTTGAGVLALRDRLPGIIMLVALAATALVVGVMTKFDSLSNLAPRYQELASAARAAAHPPTVLVLLGVGFKAGLLSFGGAYTALPYLRRDAVDPGALAGTGPWMSHAQFLDALAITSVIPAPLLIVGTFVGYLGAGPLGAAAVTVGIFLPAFAFTFVGHQHIEWLVRDERCSAGLQGAAAGAAGIIAATCVDVLSTLTRDVLTWLIVPIALAALLVLRQRWAVPLVMGSAALVGVLFR